MLKHSSFCLCRDEAGRRKGRPYYTRQGDRKGRPYHATKEALCESVHSPGAGLDDVF